MNAKKIGNIMISCQILMLLLCGGAMARTMTLEFTKIWIDHNDKLYIDGATDTLQWHYQGFGAPVALHPDRDVDTQVPMHVKISDEGTVLYDQDWKIWDKVPIPSYWSPALSPGVDIPWGPSVNNVFGTFTGRHLAGFDNYNLGDQQMKLYFFDNYAGPDYYTAKIEINYSSPVGLPEPATMVLLGFGLLGITAIRRLSA